jgi:FAD:protein FMN transferase
MGENAATTANAPSNTAGAPPVKHVEHCMGTVFSIDIRDPGLWTAALAQTVSWLHRVDAIFSTYKPDSDISRVQRGALRVADADPLVAEVLELCADVETRTRGYFTARRGHTIDPTGLVKGWAIDRAARILTRHGATNFAINGGGDILTRGFAAPGQLWHVGIADPHDRTKLITTVRGHDFAVATSGVAERGQHIVDPFTGSAATATFSSATVIGPSIIHADAYATAAYVMGADGPAWMDTIDGYELLAVTAAGTLMTSAQWPHTTAV